MAPQSTTPSRGGRWCEQAARTPPGEFHPEPFTKGYSLMGALVLWIAVFTSLPLCCCAERIKSFHHDPPQEFSGGPEKHRQQDEDVPSSELFSPKWAKEYFNASAVVESNTVGCFPGRGSYVWTVSGLGSNLNRESTRPLWNSDSRDGLYPHRSRLEAVSGVMPAPFASLALKGSEMTTYRRPDTPFSYWRSLDWAKRC